MAFSNLSRSYFNLDVIVRHDLLGLNVTGATPISVGLKVVLINVARSLPGVAEGVTSRN